MKVIIAGGRDIDDYELVEQAVKASRFLITEVVSGCARGVDLLGERWAELHSISVKRFPADWKDLNTFPCYVKQGVHGPYNALAGHARNQQMADYADALIAIWDGVSKGTKDMITRAHEAGLRVFVYKI